ncbi:MAG: hypothetical protein ACKV2O_17720 [Acidimicrobiales bacterium]
MSVNSPPGAQSRSINPPIQSPSITDLRDRLLTEFEGSLPERFIDGVLRGYLDRYEVADDEPTPAKLRAVERATRLALAARRSW